MFGHTHARYTRAQTASSRDPRQRLQDAMIEAVARCGYDRATVDQVLAIAELPEAVFDEHFYDRHDCFAQALDELLARGERAAVELFELDAPWAELVRLGIERLLQALAEHPAAARALFLTAPASGGDANKRVRTATALLTSLIEQGRHASAEAEQLPSETSEAIVGGVMSILHRRVLEQETAELPKLCPELTYFALLPYLEHERALEVASSSSGSGVNGRSVRTASRAGTGSSRR